MKRGLPAPAFTVKLEAKAEVGTFIHAIARRAENGRGLFCPETHALPGN